MPAQTPDDSARHGSQPEAARRAVIKQRARELKRSLLESTLHLSPEDAGSAYKASIRQRETPRRWGSLCLLAGATWLAGVLSMMVPVASTYSFQLPLLTAASAASAASQPADVFAMPLLLEVSQCERLRFDQAASIRLRAGARETDPLQARITKVVPGDAVDGATPCRLDLQVLEPRKAAEQVDVQAEGAMVAVQLPMQPRSWGATLVDKTIQRHALSAAGLYASAQGLGRESLALLGELAQDTGLGRVLAAYLQPASPASGATADAGR